MNVYLRELRAYRRSTLVWAASLSGIMVVFMTLYPAFSSDLTAVKKLFDQFPPALLAAFNLSSTAFFTINGFYGYLLTFTILAAAIQAMNIGTGIISKEVSGKTVDFLLSKPVTRAHIITAKLAAALTSIVIVDVVFWAVAYTAALMASKDPFDVPTFALMSLSLLLVQLMFVALGALFAVSIPKIKSVVSVTLPTVFTFFIIGMIGDVLGNDSFRYVSPFKFYNTTYIIMNVRLDPAFLLAEAAILVAAITASYVIYIRKDIRASA